MSKKGLYILAWALAVGAISYHELKDCGIFPRSPRIMKAALVFTMIYITSFFSEELAGVTAIGMVIALFVSKSWTADCSQAGATGTPHTTAFLTGDPNNPDLPAPAPFTAQPASYGAFTAAPMPTSAQQTAPGGGGGVIGPWTNPSGPTGNLD